MGHHEIDAVEMTRRIRADHAQQLQDASPEERIRFFRQKARPFEQRWAAAQAENSAKKEGGPDSQ